MRQQRTLQRINAMTALTRLCCWPGCGTDLRLERIGPLCPGHADLICEAVEFSDAKYREPLERERTARLEEAAKLEEQRLRQRRSNRDRPGWIYYIQIGDRIKVGYTTDMWQRVTAYPPDSRVLAVHPGTPALERQLHREFAEHRAAKREWYRPAQQILDYIARAVAEFGEPPSYVPERKPKQQIRPKGYGAALHSGRY